MRVNLTSKPHTSEIIIHKIPHEAGQFMQGFGLSFRYGRITRVGSGAIPGEERAKDPAASEVAVFGLCKVLIDFVEIDAPLR